MLTQVFEGKWGEDENREKKGNGKKKKGEAKWKRKKIEKRK